MKKINWNREKNIWLKENRGISFEDVLYYLEVGNLIDDIEHPNHEKYQSQRILVICIHDYVYYVPYVETDDEMFLKTIIPSRKETRKYLRDKS